MKMRLFIAINFGENELDAFEAARDRLRERAGRANYSRRENLHLTLAFLGEQPQARLPRRPRRHARRRAGSQPFTLRFERSGRFRREGGDILVARPGGLPGSSRACRPGSRTSSGRGAFRSKSGASRRTSPSRAGPVPRGAGGAAGSAVACPCARHPPHALRTPRRPAHLYGGSFARPFRVDSALGGMISCRGKYCGKEAQHMRVYDLTHTISEDTLVWPGRSSRASPRAAPLSATASARRGWSSSPRRHAHGRPGAHACGRALAG